MAPTHYLGDFLFDGIKGDVADKLYEAFDEDDEDLEFFLLIEDF